MRKYLDIIKEQETNYTDSNAVISPSFAPDADTGNRNDPRDYRNKRLVKLVQKKNELLDMLDEVNKAIDDIVALNQKNS